MKNYTYVFTLFTFFENPTFYVFSVVAHVFSNTGDVGELGRFISWLFDAI